MSNKKIQWKEGMLLKPHHFQYQDLYHEENLQNHVIKHHDYYWGFNLLELDQEALNQSLLKIQKAEGYFQDGSYFNIPNLNASPSPMVLDGLADCTIISLTVTNKTIKPYEATYKYNFVSSHSKVHNCDSDEEDIIEICFKSKQLNLKHDDTNAIDYHCLAVAKIDSTASTKINQNFLPTFINTKNYTYLNEKIELLRIKLKESIKLGAKNYTDDGTRSILQKLRVKDLKEALHRLNYIYNKSNCHPQELYFYLTSLKLQLDENHLNNIHEMYYEHDDATKTFHPLINEVFNLLKADPYNSLIRIKFTNYDQSYWLSEPISEDLIDKEWFLNIQLVSKPNAFNAGEIIRQIKLATPNSIQLFLKQALPGIKLSSSNSIISSIDKDNSQYLFKIHINSYSNSNLESLKQLVLHTPLSLGELKPELWIKKAC